MKKLVIAFGLALSSTVVVADETTIYEEETKREYYAMMGVGINGDNSRSALLTVGAEIYKEWSLESSMVFFTEDYKSEDGNGGKVKTDSDVFFFTLAPVYTYSLTQNFDVYGKTGLQIRRANTKTVFSGGDLKKDQKHTGTGSDIGYTYGFGVQYTTTQPIVADSRLRIRAGADWHKDFNGNDGVGTTDKPVFGFQAGLTF